MSQEQENQEPLPEWQTREITARLDGSYVIINKGHPYHVPDAGEWAELWAEVHAYAQAHPGQVQQELPPPPPPEPSSEERILAQIAALEAGQTNRMIRGAALGNAEDVARLTAIETQIAALRAELAAL